MLLVHLGDVWGLFEVLNCILFDVSLKQWLSFLETRAAFSNKDSYQKEVKISTSQNATLSCEVSDLKTEVKWFKDGKQLSSSKTVHMESKGKSRLLVLENVEKKDAGEYICEAGNEKLPFKIRVEGKNNMPAFWLF